MVETKGAFQFTSKRRRLYARERRLTMTPRRTSGDPMVLQTGVEDLFKKCEISVVE